MGKIIKEAVKENTGDELRKNKKANDNYTLGKSNNLKKK